MSFFIKVLIIYLLCYAYIRLWMSRMLSENITAKRVILLATDILTLIMPVAMFFRQSTILEPKLVLLAVGYIWASIIVCSVPFAVCAEFVRIVLKIFKPGLIFPKLKIFYALCLAALIMVVGGYISATSPAVTELTYDLTNGTGSGKTYNIAAISDLHAGELMTQRTAAKVVKKINNLNPDIIIMAGDILDNRDCEINGSLQELAKLSAPLGKYAILGNHEYYIGANWSIDKLKKQGIKILRDSYAVIDDHFILAGRDDFAGMRFNSERKNLNEFLPAESHLPVILMDHTPFALDEAADYGVALQFSGHTHNGQLYPFNYIVDQIYEVACGLLNKKDTLFYVSSGVGFWGPPLRTNSRSQIVLFHLTVN